MKRLSARIVQTIIVFVVEAIAILIVAYFGPSVQVNSFWAALLFAIILSAASAIGWWLFIQFVGRLPAILYPIIMFIIAPILVKVFGDMIPGIEIFNWWGALVIIIALTVVNMILGGLLSLDEEDSFDRNVTLKMVQKYGNPTKTDVPGFLFLEIDGLGQAIFKQALDEGLMPTLKGWLDSGSHKLIGWETDFSAQTGAMQSGILLGNNTNIPAYRWWDRAQQRIVMTGNPKDATVLEAALSHRNGIASDGGSSRGNMFSGDATESILTFSTVMDRSRDRGPGFYAFLFTPFVVFRVLTRYFTVVIKEWYQQIRQRIQKDPYRVSARNFGYAFFRALMGPIIQEVVTYSVITDVMRGLPSVYALYAGYDDLAHFAGMLTEDALEELAEADRMFARVERSLKYAPRPYHIVVLSDHGQSRGLTFKNAHGVSLEDLVKGLVKEDEAILALTDTNEAFDNISAFLNESANGDTRTAGVVKRAMESRTQEDGTIEVGPDRDPKKAKEDEAKAKAAKVVVVGSGCTGLINFKGAPERMTYEQIQDTYPDLLLGLANHPGIGWVLVKSETNGSMVIGKGGINYIDVGTVEGVDPLAVYGPGAVDKVKRESSFHNCPDILVNTMYDPATGELCGFENQASHHGGLGGPQNHPFVFYPSELPYDGKPIVGAMNVHRLIRGWREKEQGMPDTLSLPPASESAAEPDA
ncbi:MAG: phage holin family protein [Anaerolineae bacterium]